MFRQGKKTCSRTTLWTISPNVSFRRSLPQVELADSGVKSDFTRGANWAFTSLGRNTVVRDEAREVGTVPEVINTMGSFALNLVRASISAIVSGCKGSKSTIAQSGSQFVKNNWMPMLDALRVEKPSRSVNSFAVDVPNCLHPTIRMLFLCLINLSRREIRLAPKRRAPHRIRYHAQTDETLALNCFAAFDSVSLPFAGGKLFPYTPYQIGRVSSCEGSPS